MKTKLIPFDLEMAKSIQAGEIKGKIKTRDGEREMRIICYDSTAKFRDTIQPIIAQNVEVIEELYTYYNDGSYLLFYEHPKDLVLEVPDNEPQFKPFDKVLCRDHDDDEWKANLFSHEKQDLVYPYYMCGGNFYKQCIPYEGNQELVGTTNKPKED